MHIKYNENELSEMENNGQNADEESHYLTKEDVRLILDMEDVDSFDDDFDNIVCIARELLGIDNN